MFPAKRAKRALFFPCLQFSRPRAFSPRESDPRRRPEAEPGSPLGQSEPREEESKYGKCIWNKAVWSIPTDKKGLDDYNVMHSWLSLDQECFLEDGQTGGQKLTPKYNTPAWRKKTVLTS